MPIAGVGVGQRDELVEPGVGDDGVVVEQDEVVAPRGGQPLVAGGGEAAVRRGWRSPRRGPARRPRRPGGSRRCRRWSRCRRRSAPRGAGCAGRRAATQSRVNSSWLKQGTMTEAGSVRGPRRLIESSSGRTRQKSVGTALVRRSGVLRQPAEELQVAVESMSGDHASAADFESADAAPPTQDRPTAARSSRSRGRLRRGRVVGDFPGSTRRQAEDEPGVAQGLGQAPRSLARTGRPLASASARHPPTSRARATAPATPASPGRSRAGRACWPSGAGSPAPTGPAPPATASPSSRGPRRPGAGCRAAADPARAAIRAKTATPLAGCGLTNVRYSRLAILGHHPRGQKRIGDRRRVQADRRA